MTKGIDCASKLSVVNAMELAAKGITHVGRYLSDSWKGLTKDEVAALKKAGLEIISLYETLPLKVSYFTTGQAKKDIAAAEKLALALGQTKGSVIYFAVDYDAQPKDFDEILVYFTTLAATSKIFKVGAYGSYSVLEHLHNKKAVAFFYQTYAWSRDKQNTFANVFQYENDTTFAGIPSDLTKILKSDVGAWGKVEHKPAASTTTYYIQEGDTFWELEQKHKWEHGTLQKLNPKANAGKLSINQKIIVPAAKKK